MNFKLISKMNAAPAPASALRTAIGLGMGLMASIASAENDGPKAGLFDSQWYASPSASYTRSDDSRLGNGIGGVAALGYREGFYAIEAGVIVGSQSARDSADVRTIGGTLNALIFPFAGLPGFFGNVGVGAVELRHYPVESGEQFSITQFHGGLGYLLPLQLGSYRFALRGEALYRYGRRENGAPTNVARFDPDVPRGFNDLVVNVGLYLPVGAKPSPGQQPDARAEVVPVEASPAPETNPALPVN